MKKLHLVGGSSLVAIHPSTPCTFCEEIKDVVRKKGYSGASVCTDCAEQIAVIIQDNTPFPDQVDQEKEVPY